MGTVCSSSGTLGGIVKYRIHGRTSQRTCQIFMFAPELEKTLTAEVRTPGGADVRSDRCLFAPPTPAALVMCEQAPDILSNATTRATLAQAGRLFNLKPSSSLRGPPPSPRIDPKAHRRAGPGLGGANVAVADYTTTGRLTDGLVNC